MELGIYRLAEINKGGGLRQKAQGTAGQYLNGVGTWTTFPTSLAPTAHSHKASEITEGTLAIARIPTGTTSSTVALGNHIHLYAGSSSAGGAASSADALNGLLSYTNYRDFWDVFNWGLGQAATATMETCSDMSASEPVWVSATLDKRPFFEGNYFDISENTGRRYTFGRFYDGGKIIQVYSGTTGSIAGTAVLIEQSSDGSTWVTVGSGTVSSTDNPIVGAIPSYYYARVTLSSSSSTTYCRTTCIKGCVFRSVGSSMNPLPFSVSYSDLSLRPISNGVSNLGSSSYRWNNVYGVGGNFSGNLSVTGSVTAESFSGVGSSITSLDASNLSSGTVPIGRLPTGTTSTTVAFGDHTHAYSPTSHASSATTYGLATASLYGHAMASSATPLVAGTASVGTDNGKFAREDHVHPAQTSVSGSSASCTGNSATATKLETTRALTIGNAVKNFDGSAAVSWTLAEIGAASSGHTHLYAGSATAGGAATTALACTGNSATASAWATGRTLTLTGAVTGTSAAWTGSDNLSLATTLTSIDPQIGTFASKRGTNLISNGYGELGNNYNWPGATFIPTDARGNAHGSFMRHASVYASEKIKVDLTKEYEYSCWIKAVPDAGQSINTPCYIGLDCFDIDGNSIGFPNYAIVANTTTTLAQDLKNGDTKVYLTNGSAWSNSVSNSNRIIFWNYIDSTGYEWPVETYSRNQWGGLWDYNTGAIDTSTGVITLKVPWANPNPNRPDGVFPAGTPLSQGRAGNTYIYPLNNSNPPTVWTKRSAVIKGVQYGAMGNIHAQFRPGTVSVSPFVIFTSAQYDMYWCAMDFRETTASASHTHSYLPLSGGSLTGSLSLSASSDLTLAKHAGLNRLAYFDASGKVQSSASILTSSFSKTNHTHLYAGSATAGGPANDALLVGNDYHIPVLEGGFFKYDGAIDGAVTVVLPTGWVGTMISFTVVLFDDHLEDNLPVEYRIGGYLNRNGYWRERFAYSLSGKNSPYADLPVRFGYDGSKCAIQIGRITSDLGGQTEWRYPQIFIRDLHCGYAGLSYNTWKTGWSITFETEELPQVDVILTDVKTQASTADRLKTSRALKIGNKSHNFDGSAGLEWTLADIGALSLSGGTLTGDLSLSAASDLTLSKHAGLNRLAYFDATGKVLSDANTLTTSFSRTNHNHDSTYLKLSGGAITGEFILAEGSRYWDYNPGWDSGKIPYFVSGQMVVGTITKDSFALASHTHLYAGSDTAGGPATTALACTGNASTATKLSTARTISLSGSVTGSVSFDGSGDVSITTETNHAHSIPDLYCGVPNIVPGRILISGSGGSSNPTWLDAGTNGKILGWASGAPAWVDAPTGSTVSPGNPTASVGLSAVNGSAATFMRSDAAPKLNVGISPTWTGSHTFSGQTRLANVGIGAAANSAYKLYLEENKAIDVAGSYMGSCIVAKYNTALSSGTRQGIAMLGQLWATGGTLSHAKGLDFKVYANAGHVDKAIAINAAVQSDGGTIGTAYGLYLERLGTAPTVANYGIWQDDAAATNVFKGPCQFDGGTDLLPSGTNGQFLSLVSGAPAWVDAPSSGGGRVRNFRTMSASGTINHESGTDTLVIATNSTSEAALGLPTTATTGDRIEVYSTAYNAYFTCPSAKILPVQYKPNESSGLVTSWGSSSGGSLYGIGAPGYFFGIWDGTYWRVGYLSPGY